METGRHRRITLCNQKSDVIDCLFTYPDQTESPGLHDNLKNESIRQLLIFINTEFDCLKLLGAKPKTLILLAQSYSSELHSIPIPFHPANFPILPAHYL
ncbi:MAG: hypothetical protein ACXWV1_05295, partial [Chitinophagaceae bacterium]